MLRDKRIRQEPRSVQLECRGGISTTVHTICQAENHGLSFEVDGWIGGMYSGRRSSNKVVMVRFCKVLDQVLAELQRGQLV